MLVSVIHYICFLPPGSCHCITNYIKKPLTILSQVHAVKIWKILVKNGKDNEKLLLSKVVRKCPFSEWNTHEITIFNNMGWGEAVIIGIGKTSEFLASFKS